VKLDGCVSRGGRDLVAATAGTRGARASLRGTMMLGAPTSSGSHRGRTPPRDDTSWPGTGAPSVCRGAGTTNGQRRGLAVRGGTGRGGRSLPEVQQGCGVEDIT
jgi:hypothetical protein